MRYAQTVPPHQIPTRQSCNPGRGGCHNKRSEKNTPPRALPSAHQGCYIGRDRRSQHHRESETKPSTRRRQNAASTCAHSRSRPVSPHNKPPQSRSRRCAHEERHPTTKTPSNVTRRLDIYTRTAAPARWNPHPTSVIPHATPATPTLNKAVLQHHHRSGKRMSPQPHGTKTDTTCAAHCTRATPKIWSHHIQLLPKGGISAT